ncbi:PREDICTED: E3 ubiquitin-protein ligase makorin-1 [Myotis brandtii]|uniref:E3 ubiquitin-protein ligase makorin-1 n=1 Tax=Myotis brandtii TaxID=109478 RepID=UPI000703FEED|nr:PREDICTED: E3 ubiquitin-protein ligase makorin-1 [Myotis brandtii]
MHGVCKEGDTCRYSHDLSDSPYGVLCKYFQRGYCIYGGRCRYEHSKPLKQEEATATDLTAKPSLAASSSLSPVVGPIVEMNTGEAESNSNFATVGAGSEDWVNAIEFVPGQPYCGRTPLQGSVTKEEPEKEPTAVDTKKQLCPYAAVGECRYGEGRGSCPFGGNCFYKHAYPDGRREEPQRQKVGTSSRYRAQRRNHFWELIEERENSNPFDDEEEVVTFELGEMLLMLLAAGGDDDDELTDSEDEWDLFHDELEDFYDLDL